MRDSKPKTSVVVTLVHGTWARGFWLREPYASVVPRWFEPGGEFFGRLETALNSEGFSVEIRSFSWSGKNSLIERDRAASSLRQLMTKVAVDAPDTWHLLVGHSHGGTVIARAVAGLEFAIPNMAVASIAAPYLNLTIYRIGRLRKTSIFVLICFFFFEVGHDANQKLLATSMHSDLATLIVLLANVALSLVLTVRLTDSEEWRDMIVSKNSSANITTPYFVLRSRRDEATLGIALGNTVEILSRLVRAVCTIVIILITITQLLVFGFVAVNFIFGLTHRSAVGDIGLGDEPILNAIVGLLIYWIFSDWKSTLTTTAVCLLSAAVFRAVNGRELGRCVAGVRARVSGIPSNAKNIVSEYLQPHGYLAHALYRHPEAASRIARWFARIISVSKVGPCS